MKALRRTSELEPTEASYPINMHMVAVETGRYITALITRKRSIDQETVT